MARLILDRVSKSFGSQEVLHEICIDVADGELLAVLGPSGCGKTTLLRLVAGFETLNGGSIAIGGRRVSGNGIHVPPEDRRVGIVFQSYALWPHMTVEGNVEYALRVAGTPAEERRRRVADVLSKVGLEGFGSRRPAELSGGQRQRVALARCLVMEPSLVLLDEPLANLDVHLRASVEAEFVDFHRRTGTTLIYITHDQAEAMALADRIAVLDQGVLMQIAPPAKLYAEPANAMVAGFVGRGMVVPAVVLTGETGGRCRVSVFGTEVVVRCASGQQATPQAMLCLRPRDLNLASGDGIPCRLSRAIYQGGCFRLEVQPDLAADTMLTLDVPDTAGIGHGDRVDVTIRDGWVIPA